MNSPEYSHKDLAIIGGGINGAGLAAQASQAGLSVVLFEMGDFASGTSSKSTKLIHGGIRYLEQARFPLVFESLHERKKLLHLAPHLVRPITFLLPSYQGDERPAWMLKIGLWLYDLLAGKDNIARHRWISPGATMKMAPGLKSDGLRGCGLYYDAQTNDARLVLENILAAEESGAQCRNYCRVSHLERHSDHLKIYYQDERSGQKGDLTASFLVNASGPWANHTARLLSQESPNLVRPTRGTHIVVPAVLKDSAVLVMNRKDNRIIFVIPWRDQSLVGTTDLDHPDRPDQVDPTEEEILYLLKEASRVFPGNSWQRDRVISAFAGLRPLAWDNTGHASSVSREDKFLLEGHCLTIVGGKLTTYHSMARKALHQILKILHKKSTHSGFNPLPGTPTKPWEIFLNNDVPSWSETYPITQTQAFHLAHLYGQKGASVLELAQTDPQYLQPIHPQRPEILAQVAYAVENEKALHLEDVMLRRLEIGYSPERGLMAAEKVSNLMAKLLNWDETNRLKELDDYQRQLYPPL